MSEQATPALPLSHVLRTRGLSQGDLAQRAKLRRPTISNIISGRCWPREDSLGGISKALNVTMEDLLEMLKAEQSMRAVAMLNDARAVLRAIRRGEVQGISPNTVESVAEAAAKTLKAKKR